MEGKINNCWSAKTKDILSLLDIISGVFQRWLIQNHKSCERFFRSFYSFLRFLPHQPLYRPSCSIGSISVVASGVLLLGQQHVLYTTLHWLVLWRGQTGISSQRRNNTASSRLPVVSYNAQLAYSEVSGATSNGGRDLHITLDSYRLPQAGQPPASEVLSRHGLPSSLGVWGLGYADKQIVASLPGKKTYLSQRKINKKRTALKLGCSNVHTMTTELDGLPKISDVRTHSSAPMPHPWPPYLRQKTYLNDTMKNIHSSDHLVLLGDFNARVGAYHESWSSCLCCFGVGKINENGSAGWRFALIMDSANSYLQTKPQHRMSWCHPRSKH